MGHSQGLWSPEESKLLRRLATPSVSLVRVRGCRSVESSCIRLVADPSAVDSGRSVLSDVARILGWFGSQCCPGWAADSDGAN